MTTIREMVSEVLDNLERFPKGWGTTVKDYFKAKGKDHLEVKQTKVWMLTIRKAYEGVMPDTVICRKLATAKAKMEADISETLANADGEFDAADLNRVSDTRVTIGDDVEWVITQQPLRD